MSSLKSAAIQIYGGTQLTQGILDCKLPENATAVQFNQWELKLIAECKALVYVDQYIENAGEVDILKLVTEKKQAQYLKNLRDVWDNQSESEAEDDDQVPTIRIPVRSTAGRTPGPFTVNSSGLDLRALQAQREQLAALRQQQLREVAESKLDTEMNELEEIQTADLGATLNDTVGLSSFRTAPSTPEINVSPEGDQQPTRQGLGNRVNFRGAGINRGLDRLRVPKKLSMDEEIALSGRIFQNRVGKHMKAHLLSPAYAEGVAEEINKEAGILTGLHLIGVRLLLQASFGTAQQLSAAGVVHTGSTLVPATTIRMLMEYMGPSRYHLAHQTNNLALLLYTLRTMIIEKHKDKIPENQKFFAYNADFMRRTAFNIVANKANLASHLTTIENLCAVMVLQMSQLSNLEQYCGKTDAETYGDNLLANTLLGIVGEDPALHDFHKPYRFDGKEYPSGGYEALKAEMYLTMAQLKLLDVYGFVAGATTRRDKHDHRNGNKQTGAGIPAVNAVTKQSKQTTASGKPKPAGWVTLCAYCYCCKGGKANTHNLSECSFAAKENVTNVSAVLEKCGEAKLAKWREALKKKKDSNKAESEEGASNTKKPSRKDTKSVASVKFVAIQTADDSDSDDSFQPAYYQVNMLQSLDHSDDADMSKSPTATPAPIASTRDPDDFIADQNGVLRPVRSLWQYDNGAGIGIINPTHCDNSGASVINIRNHKTGKVQTALGHIHSCAKGYSPLLRDTVMCHDEARTHIISEARAFKKGCFVKYQKTHRTKNPCPMHVDLEIDGITIRAHRYSDGLFYITDEAIQAALSTVPVSMVTRSASRGQQSPHMDVTPTRLTNESNAKVTVTSPQRAATDIANSKSTSRSQAQSTPVEDDNQLGDEQDITTGNELRKTSTAIASGNQEIGASLSTSISQSGKPTNNKKGNKKSKAPRKSDSQPIQAAIPPTDNAVTATQHNSISPAASEFSTVAPPPAKSADAAESRPPLSSFQEDIEEENSVVVDDSESELDATVTESEGVLPKPPPEPPPSTQPISSHSHYTTRGTATGYAKAGLSESVLKLKSVAQQLHYALGCAPYSTIADMLDKGKIVHESLTGKLVRYLAKELGPCDYCNEGKARQASQSANKYDQSIESLATGLLNVCMDLMFTKSERRQSHPALLVVLELHNFVNLVYLNSKSTKDVQSGLDKILTFFEKYGHKIDSIKCDREGAFVDLSKRQYKMDLTAGVGYHQALAEAFVQIIQRIFMCILKRLPFNLPRSFVPRLTENCAFVHNNKLAKGASVTPQEAVMGIKPTLDELIKARFGRIASFTIPEEERKTRKILSFGNDIADVGIVIGCETRNPSNLKVWLPHLGRNSGQYHIVTRKAGIDVVDPSATIAVVNKFAEEEEAAFKLSQSKGKDKEILATRNQIDVEISATQVVNAVNINSTVVGNRQHQPGTRAVVIEGKQYLLPPNAFDHISIKQLRKYLPQEIIDKAVVDELVGNMEGRGVWQYLKWDTIKPNDHILRSSLFLKTKEKKGLFDKLKARFVCDGSMQRESEYSQSSSPTVAFSSVLFMLSMCKILNAKLATVDVPAAFLNAKLKEQIYMLLDSDIADILVRNNPKLKQFLNKKGQLVVLLLMCIYGLKQAGAEWFIVLTTVIIELGYTQSKADRCIFFKSSGEDKLDMIGVHVDDCLVMYTNNHDYEQLKVRFVEKFGPMSFTEGSEHTYLGMEIKLLKDKSVFISQSNHLKKVINSYVDWRVSMDSAFKIRAYNTPSVADMMKDMQCDKVCEQLFQESVIHYVYSLSYLAQRTRPDILFPVNVMATVVSCPPKSIISHLDRTFGYLSGTIYKGIVLGANNTNLSTMADVSFAIHKDGKSHTGALLFLDTSIISAKSVKQKLVTLSSTESELVGITEGLKEAQPIHKLMEELKLLSGKPMTVFQDNKSTMRIANRGEGYDGKSRHMRVRYHYIAEQIANGEIDIQHLGTTKMVADILTKPGGGSNFATLVKAIVKDMPDI